MNLILKDVDKKNFFSEVNSLRVPSRGEKWTILTNMRDHRITVISLPKHAATNWYFRNFAIDVYDARLDWLIKESDKLPVFLLHRDVIAYIVASFNIVITVGFKKEN